MKASRLHFFAVVVAPPKLEEEGRMVGRGADSGLLIGRLRMRRLSRRILTRLRMKTKKALTWLRSMSTASRRAEMIVDIPTGMVVMVAPLRAVMEVPHEAVVDVAEVVAAVIEVVELDTVAAVVVVVMAAVLPGRGDLQAVAVDLQAVAEVADLQAVDLPAAVDHPAAVDLPAAAVDLPAVEADLPAVAADLPAAAAALQVVAVGLQAAAVEVALQAAAVEVVRQAAEVEVVHQAVRQFQAEDQIFIPGILHAVHGDLGRTPASSRNMMDGPSRTGYPQGPCDT